MADLTRREGLTWAAAAAALTTGATAAAAIPGPPVVTRVDFRDPKWNRDTFARMDMDVDPFKEKVGWLKGTVYGVRENEAVRPLFVNEGFSVVRSRRLPDGSWRRMLREVVFYRDLKTGDVLKTWDNPYTHETVKVVPIYNDPFNFTISEFFPDPPSYGGLNKVAPEKKPLLMNWTEGPNGTLILQTDINLYYPSGLQPDQWPRESAGAFSRVSEIFTYVVKRSDVENPRVSSLPLMGFWSRVNPWLPWMLMGQARGHTLYSDTFATVANLDAVPQDLVAAARELDPKFLHAPTEEYGPSLSSLENYKRFQKPAPTPPGWTPPSPPPAPGPPARPGA